MIELSRYLVTPLTDAEFSELSNKCDRAIPDSVRSLLQTIGFPQNVSYLLPDDEDRFLSYQQGIPEEYCVFACDDSDDNLYAVGPNEVLFRLDPYEGAIHNQSGTIETWLLDRLNNPSESAPIWKVQLCFQTCNEKRILDLLSQSFKLSEVGDWEFVDKSQADVVTHHRNCVIEGKAVYVSRQQYDGWETPIFYLDRDIPASSVRDFKGIFKQFKELEIGFKLINYGVF